ncbi:MAG: phage holin family protein [Frankiales bacterium]|nr:phage holin family protein [Frankiales bacterium]
MSSPTGTTDSSSKSLGELLSGVTEDLSTLMRQEVQLAKAEATQSAKRAGKGVGMFAGAGIAAHFVLLFLSIALWWGLGNSIGHGWSALVVAVLWAIIGAVLFTVGKKAMAEVRGLDRTTETVARSRTRSKATRSRTDDHQ